MQGKTNDPKNAARFADTTAQHLIAQNLVYVREVSAGDLMSAGLIPADSKVHPLQKLFTLCSADGRKIAIMDDRELAFAAAREHELHPVSVH